MFSIPFFRRILSLAILTLALSGCGNSKETEPRAHVEELSYRLLPGDARILSGRFVNDSAETIDVAQIDVSLFDSDNRRISSMMVLIQNVAPGEAQEFREPVTAKLDIQGARVRSILIP